MSVTFIVDSSADLPQVMIDRYNFKIIPLSVHFGEEEYLDYVELSSSEFYNKLKQTTVAPKTSQVPPERFIEYIEPELAKGNEVVVVTIGSNASGTCQSANIAKETLGTDKVTIIDSNALCVAEAYIAVEAAKLVASGVAPKDLPKALEGLTNNGIEHLFCVDTLEYLKRGGRIKASQAFVAEVLNIKPILNVTDAITQTITKVRGRKKIIPYYIKKLKLELDYKSDLIMIGHAQDPEFANQLVEAIKAELDWQGEITISEIGATIGTHAGPGVLACFYKKR